MNLQIAMLLVFFKPTSATLDPNQGIHKPLLSNNFLDTSGNTKFLDNPLK